MKGQENFMNGQNEEKKKIQERDREREMREKRERERERKFIEDQVNFMKGRKISWRV